MAKIRCLFPLVAVLLANGVPLRYNQFMQEHIRQAMFFLHLSLEKKFKALIVKKNKNHPPFTHNLLVLAGRMGADFNEAEIKWLELLNHFNTTGR